MLKYRYWVAWLSGLRAQISGKYEAYLHQQDATAREKFFKTQWGRNYLKRVLKNYWKDKDA